MSTISYILLSTCSISLIAFVGALVLFLREQFVDRMLLVLVSFSAGALLGGAFFHLIPETITNLGQNESALVRAFSLLLVGFCTFFFLEQFIRFHHHHAIHHQDVAPFTYLILISDSIHNFIDGLIIASSFVVSVHIGIVVSLAVALHEIPQEIGDFGVLIYGGFAKAKALLLNFLSATTVVIGGIVGFLLAEYIGKSIVFLLPFAAGNFIYIACSDLIPEIKHHENLRRSIAYFFVFLLGIALMLSLKVFAG